MYVCVCMGVCVCVGGGWMSVCKGDKPHTLTQALWSSDLCAGLGIVHPTGTEHTSKDDPLGWPAGWLVGWLVDWLVGWLVVRSVGRLVG